MSAPEERAAAERKKVTLTLRLSPIIHSAIMREAQRQGLTTSRFITESVLLRVGYLLGVEAGALQRMPYTLEQDEAIQRAVRSLLVDDFLDES